MAEISNEVLAVLVIIALVISLAGTFTTLSVLRRPVVITGMDTAEGQVQLDVEREIGITILQTPIDFGELSELESNWTDSGGVADRPLPFVLLNNGTVPLNTTIEATNLWIEQSNPSTYYTFNCSDDNESGSIITTYGFCATWANIPLTDSSDAQLADCINSTSGNNAIHVHINITVPENEVAAAKSSTVSFTGTDGSDAGCGIS